MAFSDKLQRPKKYLHWFCKWCFLGVLMGIIGGALGAVFHHALHFVTHLRLEHTPDTASLLMSALSQSVPH